MLLDFEVQRSSRRCAATDLPLEPGDVCYSVLEVRGADVIRKDFSSAAWTDPPSEAFAWWRTRIPEPVAKKIKLAPNDVLLELFDQLTDDPAHQDMRYVLTLLLVRRRVFRLETAAESLRAQSGFEPAEATADVMCVYCPRREASYEVPAAMPDSARIDEIQQRLSDLLIAGAE
ncbi:MAG: hypothetical protein L0228_21325 [Planctomycetes bacterium]|nr:hypothetical protein [Planctomycetota bacterium]